MPAPAFCERVAAAGDEALGELEVITPPAAFPLRLIRVPQTVAPRLALVGDVLFQQSIGRTDFPRGNHQQLIRSIREKLFPLGDDVRFVPGHGPMSTFGDERIDNPYVADGQR